MIGGPAVGFLLGAAGVVLVQTAAPDALVVRTDPRPFFTDDLLGVLKAIGMVVAIVGATVTFFYKFTHGKVEQDLDQVGRKVNAHADTITELRTDLANMKQVVGTTCSDIGHLREGHGELKVSLVKLEADGRELHRDITAMIMASQQVITASITQVQVGMAAMNARMDERDKFAAMLDRLERDRGNAPERSR